MANKELTIFQMLGDLFKGPMKGWNIYALIFGLAVTGFLVYALIQFMDAESVTDHLHWLLGVMLAGMGIILMKVWFWIQMMKNAIMSELGK